MKRLLLLLLLFALPAWAADRFWVGGTGAYTDTAHWSASTGGAGGESEPTDTDDVFFDANSFSATGQIVIIGAGGLSRNCKSMTWVGALNSPIVTGKINVHGSLTLIANMSTAAFTVFFHDAGIGETLTTAGHRLMAIAFNGTGGWTLQDNVDVESSFKAQVAGSSLDLNGKTVSFVTEFTIDPAVTFSGSTAAIACAWNGTPSCAFDGGGNTFGSLTFSGPSTASYPYTIISSNTFGTLTVNGNNVYLAVTDGTTQTITGSLATNAAAGYRTYLTGTGTAGWTFSKASGKVVLNRVNLHYSHATGGAQFRADQSIDAGGNTGWWFGGANSPIMGCIF